jgi:hypothetical protein
MANEKNLFEVATRSRYRFSFKGQQSVEDLWALSVEELDIIFKELNSQIKQVQEESLLKVKTAANKELDDKIAIVKYIVSVKIEEAEARQNARAKREQKQQLLQLLQEKENEALKGMSIDEIKKQLAELDA